MKIGIIVHSVTGNTYSVAEKLKEKFQAAGHTVNIERIRLVGDAKPGEKNVQVADPPDASAYDGLVFGSPVHGFSVSNGMEAYLTQMPSLQGKKALCYVTKALPFLGTGGNQAIAKMKSLCEFKGATVCGTGIVIWNRQREKQIVDMAEDLSTCL
jgi:NAD(P)H dehydrogenase (quinone)